MYPITTGSHTAGFHCVHLCQGRGTRRGPAETILRSGGQLIDPRGRAAGDRRVRADDVHRRDGAALTVEVEDLPPGTATGWHGEALDHRAAAVDDDSCAAARNGRLAAVVVDRVGAAPGPD